MSQGFANRITICIANDHSVFCPAFKHITIFCSCRCSKCVGFSNWITVCSCNYIASGIRPINKFIMTICIRYCSKGYLCSILDSLHLSCSRILCRICTYYNISASTCHLCRYCYFSYSCRNLYRICYSFQYVPSAI